MFNLIKSFNVGIAAIFAILSTANCINLCGDWTVYKTTKCYNVLEKVGTEQEAVNNCTHLDLKSTLPSVHSVEEQEFIENLVKKYNNITNYIWLGMRVFNGGKFSWTDKTVSDYANWGPDAVRDGADPCVQMSIQEKTLGKWTDMSCKKSALILCQRKQELDLNVLRTAFEEQQKTIDSMKEKVKDLENGSKTVNTSPPLGFIYTQFPNQTEPSDLWPNIKWSEITSNYSGLFFRAEGGMAETFGKIQQANQTLISNINIEGHGVTVNKSFTPIHYTNLKSGWNSLTDEINDRSIVGFQVYVTSGEIRPQNTAIRIWKRIE